MSKKKVEDIPQADKGALDAVLAEANKTVEVHEVKDSDSRVSDLIKAGRATSVCGSCGEPLVRPSKPANSTWRCRRVWNGDPGKDCQKGIPTELVLDVKQLADLLARKKDRYADATDIG